MPIATKNNAIIVKDGAVAENCDCCGGWYCYCGDRPFVWVNPVTQYTLDGTVRTPANFLIGKQDTVSVPRPFGETLEIVYRWNFLVNYGDVACCSVPESGHACGHTKHVVVSSLTALAYLVFNLGRNLKLERTTSFAQGIATASSYQSGGIFLPDLTQPQHSFAFYGNFASGEKEEYKALVEQNAPTASLVVTLPTPKTLGCS